MNCPRCQQENPPQAKFCLECAAPLAPRCANCGTQLPAGAKFCFECATPVSAAGSPPQQVVLNLVMNALDAMASIADRPRELIMRSRAHACDQVLVTVRDTGVGIAAHHLGQLFSAFFTTKPGGMGMVLSISRSIIEAHGGRLWASPDTPHRAIFHFALPVERSRLPGDLAPGSRRRSS